MPTFSSCRLARSFRWCSRRCWRRSQWRCRLPLRLPRLSAVDEAASIDVLCADKTGTLTRNELKVTAVHPMPGFDESHVLGMAALASSDGGQDPVDGAIRTAASQAVASDLP